MEKHATCYLSTQAGRLFIVMVFIQFYWIKVIVLMVQFGKSRETIVSWASLAYLIIDGIAPIVTDTKWGSSQTMQLKAPLPPRHLLTVFTHYSQKDEPLRIMCKYCARWFLSDPSTAGHWHAPLSMTKRPWITPNRTETQTHPNQYACIQVTGLWDDEPFKKKKKQGKVTFGILSTF